MHGRYNVKDGGDLFYGGLPTNSQLRSLGNFVGLSNVSTDSSDLSVDAWKS
jgi:hypothetical protein